MSRHPFDLLSFVAGVVFVGLGVGFATAGADVVQHGHWLLPGSLLVLGAAGVASVLRSASADRRARASGSAEPPR
jgi:F0F1-type ATP synthase assembly protein I